MSLEFFDFSAESILFEQISGEATCTPDESSGDGVVGRIFNQSVEARSFRMGNLQKQYA
jgi:hypothetical protein